MLFSNVNIKGINRYKRRSSRHKPIIMKKYLSYFLVTFSLIFVIILGVSCGKSSTDYITSNLEKQIKQEEFEQIYNESSLNLRRLISKQEFIEKMKGAVAVMKEADSKLSWRKSQANADNYGKAEGKLKFYNIQRVLGPGEGSIYMTLQFVEETKDSVKLEFIMVQDFTTKPTTVISIPN